MSYKKTFRVIPAVCVIGPLAAACGSSSGSPGDGGLFHHEASGAIVDDGGADGGADAGPIADGTTGKACTTNADCTGDGGFGINKCSNMLGTNAVGGTNVQLWPTPICLIPPAIGNCDPAPASDPMGMVIHYCDGPDLPTSPGICLPGTPAAPAHNQGVCLPQCNFALDGSQPMGCAGKNTCVGGVGYGLDMAGNPVGVGFCQGTCEKDADCSALGTGWQCQVDEGFCTQKLVTRTKQLGQACAARDETTGACHCIANTKTNVGFCSSSCVVGSTPCPNGWICDTQTPATLTLSGAPIPITAQNAGMVGTCFPPCSAAQVDGGTGAVDAGGGEGGATGDAGAACPPNSTCQAVTVVGPDCFP
jgi:hypothetical protein